MKRGTFITRSRTATLRTQTATTSLLREVTAAGSSSTEDPTNERGRARGRARGRRSRGAGRRTSSTSRARGRGGRRGRGRGRAHRIGGGELVLGVSASSTTGTTRTLATTVEPKRSDTTQQTRSCDACLGMGHQENLCEAPATSRPRAINCRQCSHQYSYSQNGANLTAAIVLCSGHQRNIVELQNNKEKKKKKAELLIARITELVNTGVPLRDAQAFFRIDAAHYKKLQDRASS